MESPKFHKAEFTKNPNTCNITESITQQIHKESTIAHKEQTPRNNRHLAHKELRFLDRIETDGLT
jgi:hypothetical protein